MRSEGSDTSVRGVIVRVGLALGAASLLAFAATALCDYRYAVYDQAQYLVQVIDAEHPGALADDPYRTAFSALGSVFWLLVAAVTDEAHRPWAMLAGTLAIAAANALLLWRIGLALLSRTAARSPVWLAAAFAPALALVVPKEENWFGLVALSDIELTATLAVMPLLFGNVLAVIRGRLLLAFACAAAAAPIQGQTGAFLLAATWLGALLQTRDRRRIAALLALATLGTLGLAAMAWISRVETSALATYERIGLGLYNELINPLTAPASAWATTLGILGLGAGALLGLRAPDASLDEPTRRLALWGAASLALPAVGIALLALGLREPILWKLMLGRALMLPQIAALVLASVWAVRAIASGGVRTALGALVLAVLTTWPLPSMPLAAAGLTTALLIAIMACAPTRPGLPGEHSPLIRARLRAALAPTGAALATMAALAFLDRPYPWLRSADDDAWVEAQRWARGNTPSGTLFVTPPYLSGWRLHSHRPTFGEVKDGCLLFYAGEPVLDWAARMRMLGMDGCFGFHEAGKPPPLHLRGRFEAALDDHADHLASLAPDVYLVTHAEGRSSSLPGRRVWANDRFEIRWLGARSTLADASQATQPAGVAEPREPASRSFRTRDAETAATRYAFGGSAD